MGAPKNNLLTLRAVFLAARYLQLHALRVLRWTTQCDSREHTPTIGTIHWIGHRQTIIWTTCSLSRSSLLPLIRVAPSAVYHLRMRHDVLK